MKSITKNSDGTINLTAPVMIPGAKDCDWVNGEPPLTVEQIRRFAKTYEKYQFIDHEHGLTRNGTRIGVPIDSFLLTEDTTITTLNGSLKSYPRGSWFVTSQLTDPNAISLALNGGYTGYSASVFTSSRADEYLSALKSDKTTPMPCSCKDVSSSGNSLIKDVPDPVVLSVSLVKSPCLHDSEFCEVNKGEIMEEDVKSLKSKVLSAMGMSEEAEVVALKSQVSSLEEKIATMETNFQTALKSMQEEFTKTLTEALTPVAEKSEEVEETPEEEPVEEEAEVEEETTEEVEEEVEEATEEPVAEKGESKAEPIHDNISAEKSKPVNIYEYMGKNPDGTRKH
jgi:hypothetical protein